MMEDEVWGTDATIEQKLLQYTLFDGCYQESKDCTLVRLPSELLRLFKLRE